MAIQLHLFKAHIPHSYFQNYPNCPEDPTIFLALPDELSSPLFLSTSHDFLSLLASPVFVLEMNPLAFALTFLF